MVKLNYPTQNREKNTKITKIKNSVYFSLCSLCFLGAFVFEILFSKITMIEPQYQEARIEAIN